MTPQERSNESAAVQNLKRLLDKASGDVEDAALSVRSEDQSGSSADLRRSGPVLDSAVTQISLVQDENGILRWSFTGAQLDSPALPGRRAVLPFSEGEIVWQKESAGFGKNTITGALAALDRKLNSNPGLRELRDGKLEPLNGKGISQKGRLLVLVHGTFSKTEALVEDLKATAVGQKFLEVAESQYEQVLAFDHPTLSTTPLLNAMQVASLLNRTPANLDVISHSRGGLVTRWWLEMLDREDRAQRRAVVVGSTLGGTSLAAPDRIRKSMDHLTNMVKAVNAVSTLASALPFVTAIQGLMTIAASCTGIAARTPAVDALLALVPGLSAMSRTTNNAELNQLHAMRGSSFFSGTPSAAADRVTYFGVASNFQPPSTDIWHFWKYFNQPVKRTLNVLADDFIFRDDNGNPLPNDLVVDCVAMRSITPEIRLENWKDFGVNPNVHHTNYFATEDTVRFMAEKLDLRL